MHYDAEGKIAIFGSDSKEYKSFAKDKNLTVVKAMKSKK
ncbi:MAG: DUF6157 family protein [Bacteroidota bacterium]